MMDDVMQGMSTIAVSTGKGRVANISYPIDDARVCKGAVRNTASFHGWQPSHFRLEQRHIVDCPTYASF